MVLQARRTQPTTNTTSHSLLGSDSSQLHTMFTDQKNNNMKSISCLENQIGTLYLNIKKYCMFVNPAIELQHTKT